MENQRMLSSCEKKLALAAGIVLVVATATFCVMAARGGRLMMQNSLLERRLRSAALSPEWRDASEPAALRQALRSAFPMLSEAPAVRFIAPCWATARSGDSVVMLRWRRNSAASVVWTLVDTYDAYQPGHCVQKGALR